MKLGFVIWIWVMALCALFLGITGAYMNLSSYQVQMTLDKSGISPTREKILRKSMENENIIRTPVTYTRKDGSKETQNDAPLSPNQLSSLLAGETLSVYRRDDTPKAIYLKDELPKFWAWLLVGFGLLACAIIATKIQNQRYQDEGYIKL